MKRLLLLLLVIAVIGGVVALGARSLFPTTVTLQSVDCGDFAIDLKQWKGGANIEGVTSIYTFLWYDAQGSRNDKEIAEAGVQELGMVHGYSAIDSVPLHDEMLEGGMHPSYAGYYIPVYGATQNHPAATYTYKGGGSKSFSPGIFTREEYEAVKKCMLLHGQELESVLRSSYTDRETAEVTVTPVRFVSILYIPVDKLYGQ